MTPRSLIRKLFASRTPRTLRKAPARCRPSLEALEGRLVPTTFTVSRLADDAVAGSLRWAITQANAVPGDDTINFSVTGTINLAGALPDLNSNLAIQGPGAGSLTVRRNTGGSYGIFRVPEGRTVALSGLTITNGSGSSPHGGGISNFGTLTVSHSTLSGNSAPADGIGTGGGIDNSGTLTVSNSTLSGNSAPADGIGTGGGIDNSGTLTVSNSTLSGNIAGTRGGGIYNSGMLTVSHSTLSGNTTTGNWGLGGGISNRSGSLTVSNSTLSGNTTTGSYSQGGGLHHYGPGGATVSNSTLSGNSSAEGGGIHTIYTVTLINSLVVNSPRGGDVVGTLTGSHNLFGSVALGPLQLNGGPTPTHALPAGSPALGAGSNALIPAGVTTDQRGAGFTRVVNGTVDIGAFEAPGRPPTIARNQAAVSGNEASPVSNTGTFDDPDGRGTVTLTASLGTVTKDDSAGTWSWSYTPPDGHATPTVTITATDDFGLRASTTFTLTVYNVAPTITAVTVPAASKLGGPVTLSAAATDPAGAADPLTFTWTIFRPDHSAFTVTGATASFTPAASGRHRVILTVSDGDGGDTSLPHAWSLVSWWKGEGNASDVRDLHHGTPVGGVAFAPGLVGRAFSFDGNSRVEVADAPGLDLTSAATLEAWIKPSSLAFPNGFGAILAKGAGAARNYGLFVRSDGGLHLSYFTTGGANVQLDTAANLIPVGQFSHVSAIIRPAGNLMQIYRNGQLVASRAPGGPLVANTAPLTLGYADGFGFRGLIDEPTLYSQALSPIEIQSIVNIGSAGKPSWVSVIDPAAQTSLTLGGGGGAPVPGGGAPGAGGAFLADGLGSPRRLPPSHADVGGPEAPVVVEVRRAAAASDGLFAGPSGGELDVINVPGGSGIVESL